MVDDPMKGASWRISTDHPRGVELIVTRPGSNKEMVLRIPKDLAALLRAGGEVDVLYRLKLQLEMDLFHFQQEIEEHDTLECVAPKKTEQLVHRGQRIAYAHIVKHLDALVKIVEGKDE
jgi:hypothetical protein